MVKFRVFIAVDIPVFPKILEFEKDIRNSGADVKLVEPENIHITLKFLGDTEEELIDKIEEVIKESCENIKPFNINLKSSGVFPNQNYIKVVWIGIENNENLGKISSSIDEGTSKFGFEKEKRKFSAHLTIGRAKSAKNKDRLLQIINKYRDVEFGNIDVKSIELKKSELTPKGPIYTTLKEVKLGEK
jgi:2'-5' RNA ligase